MKTSEFVKIAAAGFAEAEQMIQLLKENGIAAFRRGGIMDVYTGNSVAGEDILIHEKDRDAAKQLLEDYTPVRTGPEALRLPTYQIVMNRILLGIITGMLVLGAVMAAM